MSQHQSPGVFLEIPQLTEVLRSSTRAFNSYFLSMCQVLSWALGIQKVSKTGPAPVPRERAVANAC